MKSIGYRVHFAVGLLLIGLPHPELSLGAPRAPPVLVQGFSDVPL